jgi:protein-S-isoprenylcysteine O-methyltransferase Ste14
MRYHPIWLLQYRLPHAAGHAAAADRDSKLTPNTTKSIQFAQHWRKHAIRIFLIIYLAVMLFSQSRWSPETPVHQALQIAGIALIIIAILGRTWSSLYIGGRKNAQLVRTGPYSLVRNPLYTFSFMAGMGIGLQLGSVLFGLATVAILMTVFWPVIMKEEDHLGHLFGNAYADYRKEVPRFWPRLTQLRVSWRGVESLEVRPALVVRTFVEASLFLLAIPIIEGIEAAQAAGWVAGVIKLPF